MKQLPGYEYIEEYWLSSFAPHHPLNFELFDGDKLSNTGAQKLKDIFNKYDVNNKGHLNQAETTVSTSILLQAWIWTLTKSLQLFLIAISGWNTVLESDAVAFEDLRPVFEDKNRRDRLTDGLLVHEHHLKTNDKSAWWAYTNII